MPCRPGRNTPLNHLAVFWHYSILGNYLRSNRLFRSFSLRNDPRQPAATTGRGHTCLPTPSGPPPSTSSPRSLKVLWQSCCNRSLYFGDDLDPVRLHIHPSVSEHMCHMDSAAGSLRRLERGSLLMRGAPGDRFNDAVPLDQLLKDAGRAQLKPNVWQEPKQKTKQNTELLMKVAVKEEPTTNKLIINSFHFLKKMKWMNCAILRWRIITVLVMAEVVGQTGGRGGGG